MNYDWESKEPAYLLPMQDTTGVVQPEHQHAYGNQSSTTLAQFHSFQGKSDYLASTNNYNITAENDHARNDSTYSISSQHPPDYKGVEAINQPMNQHHQNDYHPQQQGYAPQPFYNYPPQYSDIQNYQTPSSQPQLQSQQFPHHSSYMPFTNFQPGESVLRMCLLIKITLIFLYEYFSKTNTYYGVLSLALLKFSIIYRIWS